ncbi:MAG TPA: hypothetical protein ENJ77_00915 [Candidatus Moranbacteria bacterium]|nr:hypothetical protein [Candidatus Moranbacteria bacterium]
MFSGIFNRNNFSGPLLVLDIGTEVIKALVLTVTSDGERAEVVGVGRVAQKPGQMNSGAVSDIAGVISSARLAMDRARERSGLKRAHKAVIGIAGELVKGTTTTVHYERVNPAVKISLPELRTIIRKVQQKAYERIKQQITWEVGRPIDIRLINAAIVDLRIDGYRVTNPLDFQGHNVSISVFNAYAPLVHLGALEEIARALGVDLVSVIAEPYAVASAIAPEDALDFSAVFIDIGGGTTDIAVVRAGGLEGAKMFALGGAAFSKRLQADLDITLAEAEELKIRYSRGELDEDISRQIHQMLASDCAIWLDGVELSLQEFAQTEPLPSHIYLCGGGSALPGIKEVLLSRDWTERLAFISPPQVAFLQPSDVRKVEDRTGDLRDPQDVTPMALGHIALDFVNEEKVITQILRGAMEKVQIT